MLFISLTRVHRVYRILGLGFEVYAKSRSCGCGTRYILLEKFRSNALDPRLIVHRTLATCKLCEERRQVRITVAGGGDKVTKSHAQLCAN